ARRMPHELPPIGGAGKKRESETKQNAVVDADGRAKIRPVRSPQAMVQRKRFGKCRDKGPRILVRRWLAGEFHEARQLYESASRGPEAKQRSKGRIVESRVDRRAAAMVDEYAHAGIGEE